MDVKGLCRATGTLHLELITGGMESRGGMESIYEIYTKYIQYIQNGCLKQTQTIKLSKTLFGGREAAPKGYFAKFGFFEAAILYIFWKLLRRGLQTSDTQLKCTPWFFVARLLRPPILVHAWPWRDTCHPTPRLCESIDSAWMSNLHKSLYAGRCQRCTKHNKL